MNERGAGGRNANLIQFRAGKDLLAELVKRTDDTLTASEVAERDLIRWYGAARRSSRGLFSENEVLAMLDAISGLHVRAAEADELDRWVAAALLIEHIDQKWRINGLALVSRLTGMLAVQRLAVLDALEQIMSTDGGQPQPLALTEKIRESGLVALPQAGAGEPADQDKQLLVGPLTQQDYATLGILTAQEQKEALLLAARERMEEVLTRDAGKPLLLSPEAYRTCAGQCVQELVQQERSTWPDYLKEVRIFFVGVAPQDTFPSLAHLLGEQRRSPGAALLLRQLTLFLRQDTYAALTHHNEQLFASDAGVFSWLQSADRGTIEQTEYELKALFKELYFACATLPVTEASELSC
jgi:hypothetical protein